MTATVERSHAISALVQDEAGALNRIVSTIRRRGFNVDSLNVGASETPGYSRLTMMVAGDEEHINQCTRQMEKLVAVVEVEALRGRHVAREIVLIRLEPTGSRDGIYETALEFGARTPDATMEDIVVEFAGTPERIAALIERLEVHNVVETVRSGPIAMPVRGAR